MRVGLVCPYSFDVPGGVGSHVRGLARWLRTQGHEVLVVAPGTGPGEPGEWLLGPSVAVRANGSVAHLAVAPAQCRRARALLRDCDVVHVHEPLTPGIAYAVATAAPRLVVTHHAQFPVGPWALPLRWRAARLGRRRSLAVSRAAARTAHGVTGTWPAIVPNAITLPDQVPKSRSPLPIVLHLGRRDEPRKGYDLVVEVARRMSDEARFVAIGPGRRTARDVAEYGQVGDAERDGWLDRAEVLLAANTFGESFGLVLVEALAHGCGLVASDLPAFRAVADDPACTSWFAPGDPDRAVAALRARLRAGTDVHAARRQASRWTWDTVGPRVVEHYAGVARD